MCWIISQHKVELVLYLVALAFNFLREIRLSQARDPEISPLAMTIASINGGVLLLMFAYTPFTTQIGMQYWFLAGALHGIASLRGTWREETRP